MHTKMFPIILAGLIGNLLGIFLIFITLLILTLYSTISLFLYFYYLFILIFLLSFYLLYFYFYITITITFFLITSLFSFYLNIHSPHLLLTGCPVPTSASAHSQRKISKTSIFYHPNIFQKSTWLEE